MISCQLLHHSIIKFMEEVEKKNTIEIIEKIRDEEKK